MDANKVLINFHNKLVVRIKELDKKADKNSAVIPIFVAMTEITKLLSDAIDGK